jgi:hypothetical protein
MGRGGGDDKSIRPEGLLYGSLRPSTRNREIPATWGEPEDLWGAIEGNRQGAGSFFLPDGTEVVHWLNVDQFALHFKEIAPDGAVRTRSVAIPGKPLSIDYFDQVDGQMIAVWSLAGGRKAIGTISPDDSEAVEVAQLPASKDLRTAIRVIGDQLLAASLDGDVLQVQRWSKSQGLVEERIDLGLNMSSILAQGDGAEILIAGRFGDRPVMLLVDLESGMIGPQFETEGLASIGSLATAGDGRPVIAYRDDRGKLIIYDGRVMAEGMGSSLYSLYTEAQGSTLHSTAPAITKSDQGDIYLAWAGDGAPGWSVEIAEIPASAGDSIKRASIPQEATTSISALKICPGESGVRVLWSRSGGYGEGEEVLETAWSGNRRPMPKQIFQVSGPDPEEGYTDELGIDSFHRRPDGQISLTCSTYEGAEYDEDEVPRSRVFRRILSR